MTKYLVHFEASLQTEPQFSIQMPILSRFLCFDLPTGGYTFGFLGLMISLVMIALSGYKMLHVNDMSELDLNIFGSD